MLLAAKDIEKGSRPGFGGWQRNPLEDVTFYHHDALGSVVMLTNDKGHVVESYQYDVYGQAYNGKFTALGENSGQGSFFGNGFGYGNGKSSNVYGFTGKRYEPEAGLYAFTFRDYNPQTMRWLTVDPIKDGLNWYQYCGGDPVNWVDPMGLRYLPEDIDYGEVIIEVTSVITDNYEGGKPHRWGMSGSQTITYSSPTLSKTVTLDYVRWAEDRAEYGEDDPGYEYPAEPGNFSLSHNPYSERYQIKVEHSEDNLYFHRSTAHISEGCPLLGDNVDIEEDILIRLESGESLEIELEVIDERKEEEKEKYPLPYAQRNEGEQEFKNK
ncbi:MAG TPA: hypothetical protein DD789_11335 [Firmicutes bacterium]|nr:hypothetical protein [Bacillota bacterium]